MLIFVLVFTSQFPNFCLVWSKLKIQSHLVSLTWYRRLLAAAVQSSPLLKVFIWYV